MDDLRWVPDKDLPGVFDLVDEDGDRQGYVMPCRGVYWIGYYLVPGRPKHQSRHKWLRTSDNLPTEDAARAWVEAEVAARRSLQERGGGQG